MFLLGVFQATLSGARACVRSLSCLPARPSRAAPTGRPRRSLDLCLRAAAAVLVICAAQLPLRVLWRRWEQQAQRAEREQQQQQRRPAARLDQPDPGLGDLPRASSGSLKSVDASPQHSWDGSRGGAAEAAVDKDADEARAAEAGEAAVEAAVDEEGEGARAAPGAAQPAPGSRPAQWLAPAGAWLREAGICALSALQPTPGARRAAAAAGGCLRRLALRAGIPRGPLGRRSGAPPP